MAILSNASKAMRKLVTREARIAVEAMERTILVLERNILQAVELQVRDKCIQNIIKICGKLTVSLTRRRISCVAGINGKGERKRELKGKMRICGLGTREHLL